MVELRGQPIAAKSLFPLWPFSWTLKLRASTSRSTRSSASAPPTRASAAKTSPGAAPFSSSTRLAVASAKASFEALATATSAQCSDSAFRHSAAARSASSTRSARRRSSDASVSSKSNSGPGSRQRRCSKRSPEAAKPSTARTRFSPATRAETTAKPHRERRLSPRFPPGIR